MFHFKLDSSLTLFKLSSKFCNIIFPYCPLILPNRDVEHVHVLASEAVQALYSLVLVVFAGFAPYSLITHVNMVKNFLQFFLFTDRNVIRLMACICHG